MYVKYQQNVFMLMGHTKFTNNKKFILLSLGKDERLPSLQVTELIEK